MSVKYRLVLLFDFSDILFDDLFFSFLNLQKGFKGIFLIFYT